MSTLVLFKKKAYFLIRMKWIPLLIMTIDQITKRIATYYFERNVQLSLLGFSNTLSCNKGISFSWLSTFKYSFLLKYISIIFILIIVYLWVKTSEKLEKFALSLILGGGISNLLDRFLFNGVIDFIQLDITILYPIIFNIADVAITFGAFFLLIQMIISKQEQDQ